MKRYGVLLAIWVGGLLPVVIAVTMYVTGIGIPEGRTQHGDMIAGELQASDIGLAVMADAPKWQVVLAQTPQCGACDTFEAGIANFHAALGRERIAWWCEVSRGCHPRAVVQSGSWIHLGTWS